MRTKEFENCPRCKCTNVEWTNARDLDVLTSFVLCRDCDLITFQVETAAFIRLENMDYETTLMKYNEWAKTNPKSWYEDKWE